MPAYKFARKIFMCNKFISGTAGPIRDSTLTHECPPLRSTFAVRDCVSRHSGGTAGAPLIPLRDDSALRALSSLRGLRGAPEVPPLCRETSVSRTANVGTVGMNGLRKARGDPVPYNRTRYARV